MRMFAGGVSHMRAKAYEGVGKQLLSEDALYGQPLPESVVIRRLLM